MNKTSPHKETLARKLAWAFGLGVLCAGIGACVAALVLIVTVTMTRNAAVLDVPPVRWAAFESGGAAGFVVGAASFLMMEDDVAQRGQSKESA